MPGKKKKKRRRATDPASQPLSGGGVVLCIFCKREVERAEACCLKEGWACKKHHGVARLFEEQQQKR